MRRSWAWTFNAFLLGINASAIMVLFASSSFADSASSTSSPEDLFLSSLVISIGGLKGASVLAAVVILTQLVIKFLGTRWDPLAGQWKLLAVSAFTIVAGVSGLMLTDHLTFMAALLHSSTLATFQVFAHQVVTQITESQTPATNSTPPSS